MMIEMKEDAIEILLILPSPNNFVEEAALVKLLDITSELQKSYNQLIKARNEKST